VRNIVSDSKYLFKRGQTWWVKVAVPRTLRDTLGRDFRRSLHTDDLAAAQAIRQPVVDEFHREIELARQAQVRNPENDTPGCRESKEPPAGIGFEIVGRENFSDVTYLLRVRFPM